MEFSMAEYSGSATGWVQERFLRQRRFIPQLTVGTESANVVSVTVQMATYEGASGNDYVEASESVALLCTLYNSKGELLSAGQLKTAVVAGAAAGNITVTGIATLDELVSVVHATAGGASDGDFTDITSQFTITAANTINNTGGTATTGNKLIVIYRDRTLFHLAETGAGAEVTGTTRATLLITTDANGAATIAVRDVAGASSSTVYLVVQPLNKPGYPAYVAVTFDGS
jgi:hypothetical protein